jgi:hypothetical protein
LLSALLSACLRGWLGLVWLANLAALSQDKKRVYAHNDNNSKAGRPNNNLNNFDLQDIKIR